METRIEHQGCLRFIRPQQNEGLKHDLLQIGLIEIPYDRWMASPPDQTPEALVTYYDQLLNTKPSSGMIPGLVILDTTTSVQFYPRRWVDPKGKTGRFVARREQAFGSPLWSYVELREGHALYLTDFPSANNRWRGCDEAWHLQMAIDRANLKPQGFRVRKASNGKRELHIYSPIPMWAQRRWNTIGEQLNAAGSLMAFSFDDSEIAEELRFARSSMWLEQITT